MIFQTEETRVLILDTAWRLFMERGFFDTQMKDVAAAAGLSRTSLYRYYVDKNDLAMALVERIFQELGRDTAWQDERRAAKQPLTGLEAIALYLKRHWLSPRFRDQFVFLAEFDAYFSGARIPADFRESIRASMHADGDEPLEALFREAARDGSLRPDLDLHLAMATVLNAVRGLQQRLLLRGSALVEARPEELDLMPEELVDYLIAGLRNPEGGKR
jgi:AcrR family transcriptional regulator